MISDFQNVRMMKNKENNSASFDWGSWCSAFFINNEHYSSKNSNLTKYAFAVLHDFIDSIINILRWLPLNFLYL